MKIAKWFSFEAAHWLPHHPGKCSNLHGHSYRLKVVVGGEVLPSGMVMDYGDLSEVVRRVVIDRLDHRNLNHILTNPTAENLVLYIAQLLKEAGLPVAELVLKETADTEAIWTTTPSS